MNFNTVPYHTMSIMSSNNTGLLSRFHSKVAVQFDLGNIIGKTLKGMSHAF